MKLAMLSQVCSDPKKRIEGTKREVIRIGSRSPSRIGLDPR